MLIVSILGIYYNYITIVMKIFFKQLKPNGHFKAFYLCKDFFILIKRRKVK